MAWCLRPENQIMVLSNSVSRKVETSHMTPSQASCGVPILSSVERIDYVVRSFYLGGLVMSAELWLPVPNDISKCILFDQFFSHSNFIEYIS